MTIFDEIQRANIPDIRKPFVLVKNSTSFAEISKSVTTVLGPLDDCNVVRTTLEQIVADIPDLSAQQLNEFASGRPVIAMLALTPVDVDIDGFNEQWRKYERTIRKALEMTVFAAVQRTLGGTESDDYVPILDRMADDCWTPRADDDGGESIPSFRRILFERLFNQGANWISTGYPGQHTSGDIKAALNAEGKLLGATNDHADFSIAQFKIVETLFRLYRAAQDVIDLLDRSASAKATGGKGICAVFNHLLQRSFTKQDLLVGAFHGNFDPSELSPHHRACRPEFEEMRKRGVLYRVEALDRFKQVEPD